MLAAMQMMMQGILQIMQALMAATQQDQGGDPPFEATPQAGNSAGLRGGNDSGQGSGTPAAPGATAGQPLPPRKASTPPCSRP